MDNDVGGRITRNSLYNLARTVLSIPIFLFTTMYIIGTLGKEEFGLWALAGIISSYAQLSDFGITESLIKYIAEYSERNDTQKLNELLNTSFVLFLFLGAAFCLVFIHSMDTIVGAVLGIPVQYRKLASQVFSWSVVLFFANMVAGVFGSVLTGMQRMDFTNAIMFLSLVLNAAGTVIFLKAGYGLLGLVYNNALTTVFIITTNILSTRKLFPGLEFSPVTHFRRDTTRTIFGFGWKVQVSNITQLMIFQIDRVLLSHYMGLTAVSNYEIANRTASQVRMFILSIFSPMVPAASSISTSKDDGMIAGLYRRSFKYMASIAIPSSLLVAALAHPFIETWIGPGNRTSAYTLQILAGIYLLNVLTGPGSFILSGINKPHVNMRASVLAGIINIAGCFLLLNTVGYYGILLSIALSVVISGGYFMWSVHRNIPGHEWAIYRGTIVKPVAISIPLAATILAGNLYVDLRGYVTLVVVSLVFLAAYAAIHIRGNYFDEFDLAMFRQLNPFSARKQ